MDTNTTLYTQDFYAWTQEQAARLEARQFDALDIVNLVDEPRPSWGWGSSRLPLMA